MRAGSAGGVGLRANNFDLIRLGAALLVLFSHAFVLTGHAADEPAARLLRHVTDGGGAAVGAFFVLSGFLIARSAVVHPWRDYLRARALRIYPAFAAAVLVQALVLGPAVSVLGPGAYLGAAETWGAVGRALLFSPRPGLPGVFEGNPLPGVVNGSLWTLRVEVVCYAATLAWAWLGAPRWMVGLAVAVGFAALAGAHVAGAGLRVISVLDCLLFFAAGAAAWCWRERLALRWWVAGALLAAFWLLAATPAGPLLWHVALPYAVLRVGLARMVAGGILRRLGDVSYGVYLYAFPVEQVLVAAVPGIGPGHLALVAAPVAIVLGLASSRLVERPALRLKRRDA